MASRKEWIAAITAAQGVGAAFALAAATACGGAGRDAPGAARPAAATPATASASAAATEAPACGGTGPHDRHTAMVGCASCHPCGGTTGFGAAIVLPSGRTVAGGTYDRAGQTCSVGCHHPSGAGAPQPISWAATGPLPCTSCHAQPPPAAGRARHVTASADPLVDRASCQGCHVMTAHLGGVARVAGADGATVEIASGDPLPANPLCLGCHDGAGRSLGGNAPPPLAGWADAAGDFHGARAGAGYGGTLRAPYQRGQAPLACLACHDAHASENPYLFAAEVNGRAVPAGAIDGAGVGAAALCGACHEGNRHAGCATCHGVDPIPANGACFRCHGHEGIVNFPRPEYGAVASHWLKPGNPPGCSTHCHGSVAWDGAGWLTPVEYAPPAIGAGSVRVTGVTGASAVVEWTTSEPATSQVEYGAGALDRVAGSGALASSHWVTLGGLEPGTTYTFRVRTADQFRNVARSATATFTTRLPDAPPAPLLLQTPDAWGEQEGFAVATLRWDPVADPNGDAVQYRVIVDDSPDFTGPLVEDSGFAAATQRQVVVPTFFEFGVVYFWRVEARDATGLVSPWSSTGSFAAFDYAYGW